MFSVCVIYFVGISMKKQSLKLKSSPGCASCASSDDDFSHKKLTWRQNMAGMYTRFNKYTEMISLRLKSLLSNIEQSEHDN